MHLNTKQYRFCYLNFANQLVIMSRLATEYLQRDCILPRRVESIEADLANGYLFISILNQMGLVSEENYESAYDVMDPDAVLNNFRILARSLRPLNVSLTRKDVANIVSETPGASADLVMKIRAARESQMSGKTLNMQPAYKSIIRSARPKEFVRQSSTGVENGTPTERFYSDARSVLDRGVFAELDMKCHLQPYGVEGFKNEDKTIAFDRQVEQNKVERRKAVHDSTANVRKDTQGRNKEKDDGITERWVVTEEDKRRRQVRDLQFELATLKIDELRRKKRSTLHRKDQIVGIDAFEVNMKRNGIGGGDDGQTLSTTYEDTELFSTRLGDVARKNWPSDDDTSNFITALKLRTKENRTARYEKARRKRRATLAEQSAADNDDSEASQEFLEESKSGMDAVLKATLKKERLDKTVADGTKSHEALMEAAEEKIREFSEEYSSRAAEIDDERRAALNSVLDARTAKVAEKRRNNDQLVRGIVMEMVTDLFDGGGDASKNAPTLNVSNPQELLKQLSEMARARVHNGGSVEGVTSLDCWMSHSALAMNIGKWVCAPTPANVIAPSEDELGLQGLEGEPVDIIQDAREAKRHDSFLETAQTVLETVVQRSRESREAEASGAGVRCGIPFDLSASEKMTLLRSKKVVVLLSNGFCPSRDYWNQLLSWTGNSVCLWDSIDVSLAGAKLKPLLEGKKPTINFSSLVSIFSSGKLTCPDALASTTLAPEVMKACAEVVEASDRVLATQTLVADGTDIALASVTFTNVTCAIALGQSLWIREFVREKLSTVEGIDALMPSLVLTSRLFGSIFSSESAVFVSLVDWFVQGGTRDNAPEGNGALVEAIAGDGKAGKKPPAKKGKPGEEPPLPEPSISAVVWIHCGNLNAPCTTVPNAPDLADATADLSPSFVRYLFDCVDLAKSKDNARTDLAADGAFLLDYGVADTVINDEESTRKPGDAASKLPVYSIQVAANENVSSEIMNSALTHVPVNEELSTIEAVLSVMLDVCDIHYEFSGDGSDLPPINSKAAMLLVATRVLHIKALRRSILAPQDTLWLLHLTNEYRLDVSSIFDVHGEICASRAVELEIIGLLVVLASYSVSEVDRVMRQLQTKFVVSLKSVDKRWFESCAQAMKSLASFTPESEGVILEDLVTTLGNIIDARHMMWLANLSSMEEDGAGVILDLQNRLLEVTDLYAQATFEILRVQKDAASSLASWLGAAGYSQIPWAISSSIGSSPEQLRVEVSQRLNANVAQLYNSVLGFDINTKSALWIDLIDMDLPQTNDIRATSLKSLHCEALSGCSVIVTSACKCLGSARNTVLESVSMMKANVKLRYAYEHEVLAEWGSQLRGVGSKPDAASGSQFLQQYYFGVSDDVLNDKVCSWSGHNMVEVGDMQMSVATLAALSEEIATLRASTNLESLSAKSEEGGSGHVNEQQSSIKGVVCDMVCAAVKRIVQRGLTVPRGWKNQKRVQMFLSNFLTTNVVNTSSVEGATQNSDLLEMASTVVREMITTLLYAAIPKVASSDYIARLAKVLCTSARKGNSSLLRVPSSSENPLFVEALLKKVTADTKLAAGWWEATAAPDVVKQALESILGSVAWCCVDASGNVDLTTFLLSMCKSPTMHQLPTFEQSLLMAPSGNEIKTNVSFPSLLNDGFYRAALFASRIEAGIESTDSEEGSDLNREIRRANGAIKLEQLLGTTVSAPQLGWLMVAGGSGDTTVTTDSSTFRAQVGICKRVAKAVINTPKVQKEAAEDGEGKEEEKEQTKTVDLGTVEENWDAIDVTPSGSIVPVAGAWILEANKQLRSAAFSVRKYCKT